MTPNFSSWFPEGGRSVDPWERIMQQLTEEVFPVPAAFPLWADWLVDGYQANLGAPTVDMFDATGLQRASRIHGKVRNQFTGSDLTA